ncbi:MAG: AmmeMemoRadiSam system radical SAM enzyme [Mitsuokella jalaludinii]|uniref:AmmeMemoRadiSam system radical SAM enzyme n=1 Tax=Mitsuokella jalaludinii TaxID=187979 RepID=UPI00242D9E5B|nr:AmmeMemoRadiSam system radical SAM enzyme [Mitsuokella jalaludinii]MDD7744857.1 AmmeMemoRadiSam system radical SAM enzyme [Mitsuokella jalaludinii]
MSDATGAPGRKAVCWLCPHRCHLSDGQTGFCRARQNQGGIIRSLSYGLLTSAALDPIEKKPLYHFHPGSHILSLGSFGCNLRCPFCQNYTISQAGRDGFEGQQLPMDRTSPKEIVAAAQRLEETSGNIGVAFTYNEPLVGYEFVYDTARLLKEAGLAVVLVTNGQIEKDPWLHLLPYVDAVNIDLKGFTQSFYDWIGGDLKTTKVAIEMAAEQGVHVEVTTLVIPGKNDGAEEMAAEAEWLAGISAELPLHLSRYFPRYRSKIPMTPVETLQRLRRIAGARLRFVHLGNV